ncbi:TIGR03943 family protein [Cyanobium sp. FGCU-6]|nr:TIGR03943 family protein [Cyanobium sp. FGCU6]
MIPTVPLLRRAATWRAGALALWAAVMLHSAFDGRLHLLLRAMYHPLVPLTGVLLAALALLQLRQATRASEQRRPGTGRQGLATAATALVAVLVLALPPTPSFADLAGQRPPDATGDDGLSFVLPPLERSLTDWSRLLASQPDPHLFEGDPVRISGFVLPIDGQSPQLARLRVRCCLADASPVGLPVRWPRGPVPAADLWLAIEGTMAVEPDPAARGRERLVVVPQRIRPIPRPRRPLEP